jgi:SAF domain
MNSSKNPDAGTALYPDVDAVFNGGRRSSERIVSLARLPRRRRPGMVALAVALIGAGVLASTAVYSRTDHRQPVLVATSDVPAGEPIAESDIGTAVVSAGQGVQLIPAGQLRQVIGQVAGTQLYPGMLLTAAELTTARPPVPGQVLVPLPVRPSVLPASGLASGDQILIVATPGAQGQPGASATAPVLTSPVAGVVEAVTSGTDADGYKVVDVLVKAGKGAAVARQASTGQFSLIVVRRGS